MGVEPVVLTSAKHEPSVTGVIETIDGVRYYRTLDKAVTRLPIVRELQLVRQLSSRIEEVLIEEHPDILHAHSPCLWGKAALRVAMQYGLPFVYEVRGLWEDAAVDEGKIRPRSAKYLLGRRLETTVATSADGLITISQHLKDELVERKIPIERIFVVPNGVDSARFTPRPPDQVLLRELGLTNAICLGYVGSLYAWEGVDDLVRAVPCIVSQEPRVKLLIVGGGHQEIVIRGLIEDLGLSERILFIGQVPHKDVCRYISIMDVLVYPRKKTRQTDLVTPLKPLEAMAMCKAVLGSDVGGIAELVVDGTGLLYRAGDSADLAEKCLRLISCPELRHSLAQRARAHVIEHRSWKDLVRIYSQAYSSALARKYTSSRASSCSGAQARVPAAN
jgi:PEP-CTERM/exosortase A-associated glycosyltransferase